MPQSYLGGDRFGAFDRSFETGVQLGTQIVRDRQERQQKLEDQKTQQANELQAERNRAQLQLQNHAAELAQDSQQKALDAKAAINDPVAYRKNEWDTRSQQITSQLDAQDKQNSIILNPNDPSYSATDRANARAAIANNDVKRKNLLKATPQTYDAGQPVQFPDTNPDLAVDPNNVVTPEYTPEYRESLVKADKGGLTANEQLQEQHWNQLHPSYPGGLNQKQVDAAHGSLYRTLGAVNQINMPAPDGLITDPNAEGYNEDAAKTELEGKNKARSAYANDYPAAISTLMDANRLQAIGGLDPTEAKIAAAYATKALGSYGQTPTPENMTEFIQGVRNQASMPEPDNNASAFEHIQHRGAVALSKVFSIPPEATTNSGGDQ
jgi:hypothetical protein